ncbi:MAG: hypothetical protein J5I90_21160 [Caldilineales bacterium]|nr:hypothetical protein [Caldilineales bacterium]
MTAMVKTRQNTYGRFLVSRWLGNVSGSGVMWMRAVQLRRNERMQRLRTHIQMRKQVRNQLAWWIRFVCKSLDVIAFSEGYNLLGQILKPTTRTLTPIELTEARRVFRNSVPLDSVRIDEYSVLAWLGALFRLFQTGRLKRLGVVIAYTINFTRPINAEPGNDDMAWLMHELVHVAQMDRVGLQYYPEAIYAQFTEGYGYDPDQLGSRPFCEFNREQQGEIVRDYYRAVCHGQSSENHFACILALRSNLI